MLNKSKGNMYSFITHTLNFIKGICHHDCSYCYMKRRGNLKPVRLDWNEFKTDLSGNDKFIFVGSSCDMFNTEIPSEWLNLILTFLSKTEHKYFFQSKNPIRFLEVDFTGIDYSLCTTLETNRHCPEIMRNSPTPINRLWHCDFVTIEPIIDFDTDDFVEMLKKINPIQINIGADSGGNNLPEPPKEKILELRSELKKFTNVNLKKNLNRLLK